MPPPRSSMPTSSVSNQAFTIFSNSGFGSNLSDGSAGTLLKQGGQWQWDTPNGSQMWTNKDGSAIESTQSQVPRFTYKESSMSIVASTPNDALPAHSINGPSMASYAMWELEKILWCYNNESANIIDLWFCFSCPGILSRSGTHRLIVLSGLQCQMPLPRGMHLGLFQTAQIQNIWMDLSQSSILSEMDNTGKTHLNAAMCWIFQEGDILYIPRQLMPVRTHSFNEYDFPTGMRTGLIDMRCSPITPSVTPTNSRARRGTGCRIRAENPLTGRTMIFESYPDAGRQTGESADTIRYATEEGKTFTSEVGLTFKRV